MGRRPGRRPVTSLGGLHGHALTLLKVPKNRRNNCRLVFKSHAARQEFIKIVRAFRDGRMTKAHKKTLEKLLSEGYVKVKN
ncbi:MAG: hypothetical protein J7L44_00215 [Candidatus Diapherotrites archaeon]|nr:hypothetical protein [Candidatus Diapherotrites archaeon]